MNNGASGIRGGVPVCLALGWNWTSRLQNQEVLNLVHKLWLQICGLLRRKYINRWFDEALCTLVPALHIALCWANALVFANAGKVGGVLPGFWWDPKLRREKYWVGAGALRLPRVFVSPIQWIDHYRHFEGGRQALLNIKLTKCKWLISNLPLPPYHLILQ